MSTATGQYNAAIGQGLRQSSAGWTPYDAHTNVGQAVNLGVREKQREISPLYTFARNGILAPGQQFYPGMEITYDEWDDDIELHARQDNAKPKIQSMGMTRKRCTMGEEAEWLFKLSARDQMTLRSGKIGQTYNDLIGRFRSAGARAAHKYVFQRIVNDAIVSASCDNVGPNAGAIYHNTNTGGFFGEAAPIQINETNVDYVASTIASLADEQGIGDGKSIGLLDNSQITMFADPRFKNLLQHSKYTQDLLAGGCPDACRLRSQGYMGQSMSGVAININHLPVPTNRNGKQWGYIVAVVNGACVFEGFNDTFQILNGCPTTAPGDMFGFGTYQFGHMILERAGIFVLAVEYSSNSPFASA